MPVLFPLRVLAMIYVDFFRGVPLLLVVYAIGFGLPGAPAVVHIESVLRGLRRNSPHAVLLGLRLRGLPGRAELGAPQPGRRGTLARPYAGHRTALRDLAAGHPQHRPAAAERLHQLAEGHRAGRRARCDRGQPGGSDLRQHGVQLLEPDCGSDLVPDPDDPAGQVHRPADRPGPHGDWRGPWHDGPDAGAG